jgi:predicted permease
MYHRGARDMPHDRLERVGSAIDGVWRDARYGLRVLARSPALSAMSLLTMAVGIGLSTAMFTAVNAIVLRPWPVDDPGHVVRLHAEGGSDRRWGFSLADFEDFERRSTTFAAIAASRIAFLHPALDSSATGPGVYGQFVTHGYFDAVSVRMQMGRPFRTDEDRDGAPERVVVISHAQWQRLFAGAPDVIGRVLYFQKMPFVVVGVTREGWRGPQPYRDDVWLPLQALRLFRAQDELFTAGGGRCCVALVGRLASGETKARARDELTTLARQRGTAGDGRRVDVTGTSAYDSAPGPLRALIPVAVGLATAIVLLLTGANIAHLQLARAIARDREVFTRFALGAGRGRLVRQLVTEALMLSAFAGAAGLATVYLLLDSLMYLSEMPAREVWTPDAAVFGYCAGVSVVMSVVFSLLPALRSTRTSLAPRSGHASTPPGRLGFNLVLLTTQIALSTSLAYAATILTRAVAHAQTGSIGYAIDGVMVVTYRPSTGSADGVLQTLKATIASARTAPVGIADAAPFSHEPTGSVRRPEDDAGSARSIAVAPVSASTFDVLGLPMVEGRAYTDRADAGEAVVNLMLARMLWPERTSAVGQVIVVDKKSYTVVGVIRDVYFTSRDEIRPTIHLPASSPYPALLVRGTPAADQLEAAILNVDPRAVVFSRALADNVALKLADSRAGAEAARAGGLLALALATFGVFGVFAHVVEQRRREIGLRVALGAQRWQVLGVLFRSTRIAVVIGLASGLALAVAMGTAFKKFLYGLSPFDPAAFGLVALVLLTAALIATFIPARRALRVDPAVTLRDDA